MFSLFLESTSIKATINGKSVAGKSFLALADGRAQRRFWRFRKPGSGLKNSGWLQKEQKCNYRNAFNNRFGCDG